MLNAFSMSNAASVLEIARAAGVSKTTVSLVLNGKGDQARIAHTTQERVRAIARQLDTQTGPGVPLPVEAEAVPDNPKPEPNIKYRELGLVLSTTSLEASLSLVLGQEPILAAEGFRVVLVIAPADPESARRRILSLIQSGISGILCCPTVYSTVSTTAAGTCPVIALSPWAADSLLKTLGVARPAEQPKPISAQPPKPEPVKIPPATVASAIDGSSPVKPSVPPPSQVIPTQTPPTPVPIPIPEPVVIETPVPILTTPVVIPEAEPTPAESLPTAPTPEPVVETPPLPAASTPEPMSPELAEEPVTAQPSVITQVTQPVDSTTLSSSTEPETVPETSTKSETLDAEAARGTQDSNTAFR